MRARHTRLTTRGLSGYLRAVGHALRVSADAGWCDAAEPATAYLALAQRSPERPDRDLLLIWGEQDGWLLAAETDPTETPIVLAYLGGEDILPSPDTVARFVTDTVAGHRPGQLHPPGYRRTGEDDDLPDRLAHYADPSATA